MEEFIEKSLRNISIEGAKDYLGTYGDAIEARVNTCLLQARELQKQGYFDPAIVLAATAIEMIVRFLLVKPLVQGAFLSDEWASILANRIANGRTAEDRELLPAVLRQWSVDINKIELSDGSQVWATVTKRVWPKRNKVVHTAAPATESEAAIGIESAERLMSSVVRVVAATLGFTFETTGRWAEIRGTKGVAGQHGYSEWWQSFDERSPFDDA